MPDISQPIDRPIVRAQRCPGCRYGVLMYPMEKAKGRCLVCQMRARGDVWRIQRQRQPFRSEAEAYDEGIYDDD